MANKMTEKKRCRNVNIIAYKQKHPDITVRAMARIFKVSRTLICDVLKQAREENQ